FATKGSAIDYYRAHLYGTGKCHCTIDSARMDRRGKSVRRIVDTLDAFIKPAHPVQARYRSEQLFGRDSRPRIYVLENRRHHVKALLVVGGLRSMSTDQQGGAFVHCFADGFQDVLELPGVHDRAEVRGVV